MNGNRLTLLLCAASLCLLNCEGRRFLVPDLGERKHETGEIFDTVDRTAVDGIVEVETIGKDETGTGPEPDVVDVCIPDCSMPPRLGMCARWVRRAVRLPGQLVVPAR